MSNDPTPLTRLELQRYSRPLLVSEWSVQVQQRIRAARVLIAGAGGLGGPVALQLAGAGVGMMTIADSDQIELSNLHRQTHFQSSDIGRNKAEVLSARVQQLNPHTQVRAAPHLKADNITTWLTKEDLLIDCTDNFETRYLLADHCIALGQRWVWGAASGTTAMVSVFSPPFGLRQLFPTSEQVQNCQTLGVLGPVPQLAGTLMALEALKLSAGLPSSLEGQLWTFEALTGRSYLVNWQSSAAGERNK